MRDTGRASQPVTRSRAGRSDLLSLAAAAPERYPCLLESAAGGRYDILFAFPQEALVKAAGDRLAFLPRLDAAFQSEKRTHQPAELPFRGGWALLLCYELGAEREARLQLPHAPAGAPVAVALRCPAAVIYDRHHDLTIALAEAGHAALIDTLWRDLEAGHPPIPDAPAGIAMREEDPARFLEGVDRIHHHLRDGDVFQVNLSRAWEGAWPDGADTAALYAALRRTNPAPFAGLFRHQGLAVLSSSPERLVSVAGAQVQTRPIAGTRPRIPGDDDAARARELVGHPKERAEHIMLIDLERNDLGRVCAPGTIEVDELMAVESYTHVHHIVSNVRGRLRAGVSPGEVIGAVFPGGTVTGCPKVRCMQVIAALEGEGRGPYTGALGYLNRDGDMDLNILIRTIWTRGGEVRLRAGSGIVADSVALRELEETRAKARGMLRALVGEAA